jgi:hypothetical protein
MGAKNLSGGLPLVSKSIPVMGVSDERQFIHLTRL